MDYLRTTAVLSTAALSTVTESVFTESVEMESPVGLLPQTPLQDITNRARRPAKINFFIIKLDER